MFHVLKDQKFNVFRNSNFLIMPRQKQVKNVKIKEFSFFLRNNFLYIKA